MRATLVKVAIYTKKDLTKISGSTIRPIWQAKGLRKNGFRDFVLTSDPSHLKDAQLVHAHQDSAYELNRPYLADVHGILWTYEQAAISMMPFSYHKLRARYIQLRRKNFEKEVYSRARCLICASEIIGHKLSGLSPIEIIRNSVDLSKYSQTSCHTLRVAVVGPFVESHENKYAIPLLLRILKLTEEIKFVVIGEVSSEYKRTLSAFRNVVFSGYTRNFLSALRSCSVLLAPYPSNGLIGGVKCKVLDAAASSMGIVATYNGASGFADRCYIHGETPEELVEGLHYLEDESVRRDLGKKARTEVERSHNYLTEAAKLIKIYKRFS
jgi:glycosyltransferase involved in cell wall biosynthesis